MTDTATPPTEALAAEVAAPQAAAHARCRTRAGVGEGSTDEAAEAGATAGRMRSLPPLPGPRALTDRHRGG